MTPERLAKFRKTYNIPDDVEVRYCLESEVILLRREDRVVIPIVAVVEGGVRIPMSDLLTNFLRHFKVCLDQYTLDVFRVVSSVDTLNKRLDLKLTKHDINYLYIYIGPFKFGQRGRRRLFGYLKELVPQWNLLPHNWG